MSALKPDVDSKHDLGTTSLRWRNLFVDGITVTDNITVAGNLTVEGTTTTITTQDLVVEDPLIKLNRGDLAVPSNDQGFVFSRGDGTNADQANRVLVWDESEDEFVFGVSATEDGTTTGNIAISGYSDVAVGKLVFDSVAGDNIEINANTSDLTLSATKDIALIPATSNVLVAGNILPEGDDTYDLGSSSAAWKDIFLEGDITMTDAGKLVTSAGDLTLEAEDADAKVVIKGDHENGIAIHLDGNATENSKVQIDAGILDVDVTGAATIDAASLSIGSTAVGAVTIDSTAGISLDGASASNFTTSGGDLSLIADGADNKVVIRGDATHATDAIVAVHIDGDVSERSVVDIDAGVLDIDASGAVQIDSDSLTIGGGGATGAVSINSTAGISLDGASASNFTTSGGDLSLIADGSDAKVLIKGDATSAESDVVSIHLDGNTGTRSVIDIDAGILDIDASASISIDAVTAINIESSGGEISVGANNVAQNINIGTGNAARTIAVGHTASTKLDLKALDIDITAGANGFAVAGGGLSTLSTSSGALNITAAGASTWQTSSGALNITAAGASTWQTSSGALNITAASASTWQTSSGALTINGTNGLNLQEGGADVIAISDDKNVLFSHAGGNTDSPDVEFDGYVRFDGAVELNSTVQLDGATTFNSTLTVGADTDGHDVKLFGAASGKFLLWDESDNELVLAGDSKLSFNDAAGGENIVASSDGHLEINAGTTLDITAPTVDINATSEVTLDTPSMVVSSSIASKPVLELKNTNDDATGPTLKLALDTNNSAAANDVAGTIEFFADDAANNNQSYGEIKVIAADVTSGSESGKMTFGVATTTDGTIADIVSITGGTSASTSTVQILGNLSVIGTTTTVDQGTMLAANSVTFEGSTTDEHETVLTIADPTADRTITLPDLSGHSPLLEGAVSNSNVTAAEFALLDGDSTVSTATIVDGDGIFTNDSGEMKHVRVQDYQTYFDANSVGGSKIVTVGALDTGSITQNFGDINNGESAITTTGLGTFGSLDVDNVVIDGTTIGHTDDPNLLTLGSAALTLKGTLTVGVDDTGHDVKLFGATAGKYLLWDESADALQLTDSTKLSLGVSDGTAGQGDLELYHDGTDNYIRSREALNIATEDSVAVNIGNTTSTTTIGQDLDVTRNLTAAKVTVENIDLDDKTITMTGSTGDNASFVVSENGALSITTVDSDAAAANMTLTADGTFKAIGTTITLDSGGAINLEPAAGSAILLDNTISIDGGVVTGAVSISSTAFVGTLSTAAQPNVTSLGTLTGLGVNGDATFTGTEANMVWDNSDNALEFADSAKLLIGDGDGTTGQGDLELYHDGTNSHIVNRTGTLNIANSVNVPVTIGHASSTTTIGGVLSVTGDLLPSTSDSASLGSTSNEWSDLYIADEGMIKFGDDQNVQLLHQATGGLVLQNNSALTGKPDFTILNTSGDNSSAGLLLKKEGGSQAAGDAIGEILFVGQDDAGSPTDNTYSRIASTSDSASAGNEKGGLDFEVSQNGTLRKGMQIYSDTGTGNVDIDLGFDASSEISVKGSLTVAGSTSLNGDFITTKGRKYATITHSTATELELSTIHHTIIITNGSATITIPDALDFGAGREFILIATVSGVVVSPDPGDAVYDNLHASANSNLASSGSFTMSQNVAYRLLTDGNNWYRI